MVRLIRLTSNNNDAIFDNSFKQDIIVIPNGKIALKSLSVAVDVSKIEINGSNDNIQFEVSDATGSQNVILTHDTYDAKNSKILFHNMDISMNAALNTSISGFNDDIGIEIKNSVNIKSTKFECDFNRVKLDEYFNDMIFNKGVTPVTTTGSEPNHVYKGPDAVNPAALGDCFFYNNINICRGGGVFRLRRTHISAEAGTHAIIGFSDFNLDTLPSNTAFDINKIVFGIEVGATGTNYQLIENGVISAAGSAVLCENFDNI